MRLIFLAVFVVIFSILNCYAQNETDFPSEFVEIDIDEENEIELEPSNNSSQSKKDKSDDSKEIIVERSNMILVKKTVVKDSSFISIQQLNNNYKDNGTKIMVGAPTEILKKESKVGSMNRLNELENHKNWANGTNKTPGSYKPFGGSTMLKDTK